MSKLINFATSYTIDGLDDLGNHDASQWIDGMINDHEHQGFQDT